MLSKLDSTIIVFSSNEPAHFVMNVLTGLDIKFKVILGSYKNILETSYMIETPNFAKIIDHAMIADQESILHMTDLPALENGVVNTAAHLEYLKTGEVEELGIVIKATKEEAYDEDAFSYDPATDQYLIVVPKPQ